MAISLIESTKKVKLDLKGLTDEQKREAKRIAGQILVEEINSHLDDSTSPVKGGKYKAKKADGSPSELFEDGFLREAIKSKPGDGDFITVGVHSDEDRVERAKSYNHNVGDTLPQRRHIAAPNQVFKEDIMKRVNRAIDDIRKEVPKTIAREVGLDDLITDKEIAESLLGVIGFDIRDFFDG